MVGSASIEHLEDLILKDNDYRHLKNQTTGKWIQNEKVYCQFNNRGGGILQVQEEEEDDDGNYSNNNNFNYCSRMNPYKFGPELGFGWSMSSETNTNNSNDDDNNDDTDTDTTPILILKQAWDSSDLAVDFCPPSSDKANYKHSKQYESVNYNAMMNNLKWTIDSLESNTVKTENENRILYDTVHISGVVWFQGWNDYIYDHMSSEYEYNLANFIRDIRNELNVSNLPFVIGELGQRGGNITDSTDDTNNNNNNIYNRTLVMRQSQYNVTQYPEFYDNTMFVETSKYYCEGDKEKGIYDGIHHYYGRADTIIKLGKILEKL
ncbi:hypothetical protein FRACYDRAFT_241169 [Fragilariopsis cylindrus CCMP1102]|uniref:Sialate O-acetylesterase domain-containing protein n=1 Tax=Fragilariopsis cylindrus CCMP1102 TaxID=635003 RepID=A0A1E7F8Y1_9STRA|nr:hypothetical protein FRACYDRAFT_241169 [Fragilariopsis cylindrus CCMP1102]|eukprot:OEU14617.1 hypothetical protein FRACYDRAFT_241169 [Fragilariopsis cylindrus CCMP1102]